MRCRHCDCLNDDPDIKWTDEKIEKFTIELNPKHFCTEEYSAVCTYEEFKATIAKLRQSDADFQAWFIDNCYESFVRYLRFAGEVEYNE